MLSLTPVGAGKEKERGGKSDCYDCPGLRSPKWVVGGKKSVPPKEGKGGSSRTCNRPERGGGKRGGGVASF